MADPYQAHICERLQTELPIPWCLMFGLVAPHFLNVFVWMAPASWRALTGKSAVNHFAAASSVLKAIQVLVTLLWVWTSRTDGLCFDTAKLSLVNCVSGLVLLATGLSLSFGVLRAIGAEGVYYGSRIGPERTRTDPTEPTEWPFNVIQHPQHVGPTLLVWVPVVVLQQQLPRDAWFVAAHWTTLYVLNWVIEDYF
ncbi:hypothetical protein FOA52_006692 [Chlamydomonas sp. UWO 241]|nr:hypothetical protein FOA52_006692 [Chlamydomonas sp. UWO 241]